MNKIKLISSIVLIFSMQLGSSFADTLPLNGSPINPLSSSITLPKHYPSYAIPTGKISGITNKSRIMIVDGTAYKLHPVHNIYTLKKGQMATLYNLKPGMKVGFEFTTYQGKKVIDKVWILPKKYPTTTYAH